MTSSSPAESARFSLGELFAGKYVIEREIGAGGMGVVVAARHLQLGQMVAIKLLALPRETRPDAVERFLAEAKAAARLRSEHVARVMDAGIDEHGRHYIIMEYLQGADLGRVLRDGGPLSVSDAAGYLLQACEGIAEAHANGIVHRDLKPENLFVTRRIDGSPLVKVLDFGLAKSLAPDDRRGQLSATPTGVIMGSPLYMSPEQMRARAAVDARSDIWALGVILFELLTNLVPFGAGGELTAVVADVLSAQPVPVTQIRAEVPEEVAAVVQRALEKDPDHRYQNVSAFARALAPWAPSWARDSERRVRRTLGLRVTDAGPVPESTSPAVATKGRGRTAMLDRRGRNWSVAIGIGVALAVSGFALLRGPKPTVARAPVAASAGMTRSAPPATSPAPASPAPAPPPAPEPAPTADAPPPRRSVPRVASSPKPRPRKVLDPLEGRR